MYICPKYPWDYWYPCQCGRKCPCCGGCKKPQPIIIEREVIKYVPTRRWR